MRTKQQGDKMQVKKLIKTGKVTKHFSSTLHLKMLTNSEIKQQLRCKQFTVRTTGGVA